MQQQTISSSNTSSLSFQDDPLSPFGSTSSDIIISQENMIKNLQQIDTLRSIIMIVSGISCGIMKTIGILGFLYFLLVYIIITIVIGIKIKYNFTTYLNMSFFDFLMNDMMKHIMSFILFWTLSYTLVYIY